MPTLAEHKIRIRYEGGLARQNALPGYDGVTSIDGITRALHIAIHAYLTGEVTSRATALRGASILLKPPRRGSFEFDLVAMLEAYPATTGAVTAISAPAFYDCLKTVFRRATGCQDAEPATRLVQGIYSRKEPPPLKKPPADLDAVAEMLEGSLQDAHRPIGEEGTIQTITIGTPRQELVTFDIETKGWVNTRDESVGLEVLRGNITRFNAISRNARAYIYQLGRVVPVRPDGDFDVGDLSKLSWSLHGTNTGGRKFLDIRARTVTSASGKVKRLLLVDCQLAPLAGR